MREKLYTRIAAAICLAAVPLLAYGLFSGAWFQGSGASGVTRVSPFKVTVCSGKKGCHTKCPLEVRRRALAAKKKGGYWYVGGILAWVAGLFAVLFAVLLTVVLLLPGMVSDRFKRLTLFAATIAGGLAVAFALLYVFSVPARVFKVARPQAPTYLFPLGAMLVLGGCVLAAAGRYVPPMEPTENDKQP